MEAPLSTLNECDRQYDDSVRERHQDNSLFLQLVTLPLNASMRYDDDGRMLPVWGMSVRGHHLDVYTEPFIPSITSMDDERTPYDVSCAIASVIDESRIDDIRVVLPDNSTVMSDGRLDYDDDAVTVTLH